MKWITNCSKTWAEAKIADLTSGWPNRRIVTGPPMPTKWRSEQELLARGVVGLYDIHEYR